MIPEREREALMRLTMCARRECFMCKYQIAKNKCDDLATECMHILADALRAEQTEPQYDAEEVAKDINRRVAMGQRLETMSCQECKYWIFDTRWGWFCPLKGQDECKYKPKQTEPQTYVINPQEPTNDEKCFECDDFFTCGGQCNKIEDKPQTDCAWK